MENSNYSIETLLKSKGYFPSGNYKSIAIGCATRNEELFETVIFFHLGKDQVFHVVGHGEGTYATFEELGIAIELPKI